MFMEKVYTTETRMQGSGLTMAVAGGKIYASNLHGDSLMTWALLVIAVAFGFLRFIVPVKGLDLSIGTIYKDLAHIFIGICIGWACAGFVVIVIEDGETIHFGVAWLRWGIVVGLTAVEVIAAFVRKK